MTELRKSKLLLFSIYVILFVCFLKTTVYAQKTTDPICGPRCLVSICNYFKISVELKEICHLSGYDEKNGTSMLGLYKAAQKKGLNVKPLKISLDQLCANIDPSIVFVAGNHFCVFHRCTSKYVIIQDPPGKPRSMTKEKFRKYWKGHALVFSSSKKGNKKAKDKKPKLEIEKTLHDFGDIYEGEVVKFTYILKNAGDAPLIIKSVRPSCSCTAATIDTYTIPSNGREKIVVSYNTVNRSGLQTGRVHVKTNDEENEYQVLLFKANVINNLRVKPAQLHINGTILNQNIIKDIVIKNFSEEKIEILNIDAPQYVTYDVFPLEKDTTSTYLKIRLFFSLPVSITTINDKLVIKTNNSIKPEIVIPITGSITSPLTVVPERIFLDPLEQNEKKDILINIKNIDADIKISKVSSKASEVNVNILQPKKGEHETILCTIQSMNSNQTVKDTVSIFAEGFQRPIALIPIFARIP